MAHLNMDIEEIQRRSSRRALQPFLWCTLPGVALVALGLVFEVGWLQWIGWVLLIGAIVWAGIRYVESSRRLRETQAEYERWRQEHGGG